MYEELNKSILFSPEGRAFLLDEYVNKRRSTYDIAKQWNVYPNLIRRALKHHAIVPRTASEAQRASLAEGRHSHPTEGTKRPAAVKEAISNRVAANWRGLTPEEYGSRVETAKRVWNELGDEVQEEMREAAGVALRKTAKEGSRLEKYLCSALKAVGHTVHMHRDWTLPNGNMHLDMLLPDLAVAIEIDGPTHYLPIFGEEKLLKVVMADAEKNSLLLERGYHVIRVKQICKHISAFTERAALDSLLDLLGKLEETPRVYQLEVK